MSRIAEDRGKVARFEKAGTIELSGSRKSLKIIINSETYYVGVGDIQKVLAQPSYTATIVKIKEESV